MQMGIRRIETYRGRTAVRRGLWESVDGKQVRFGNVFHSLIIRRTVVRRRHGRVWTDTTRIRCSVVALGLTTLSHPSFPSLPHGSCCCQRRPLPIPPLPLPRKNEELIITFLACEAGAISPFISKFGFLPRGWGDISLHRSSCRLLGPTRTGEALLSSHLQLRSHSRDPRGWKIFSLHRSTGPQGRWTFSHHCIFKPIFPGICEARGISPLTAPSTFFRREVRRVSPLTAPSTFFREVRRVSPLTAPFTFFREVRRVSPLTAPFVFLREGRGTSPLIAFSAFFREVRRVSPLTALSSSILRARRTGENTHVIAYITTFRETGGLPSSLSPRRCADEGSYSSPSPSFHTGLKPLDDNCHALSGLKLSGL